MAARKEDCAATRLIFCESRRVTGTTEPTGMNGDRSLSGILTTLPLMGSISSPLLSENT
jgi:hypothetical protein